MRGGSDGKESACCAGGLGSLSWLGRSPGEGNGYPLQYSCLENPTDRGAWPPMQASPCGRKESDLAERLTLFQCNRENHWFEGLASGQKSQTSQVSTYSSSGGNTFLLLMRMKWHFLYSLLSISLLALVYLQVEQQNCEVWG